MKKQPLLPEDQVSLKNFFGISPRTYVPVLYSLVLLLVIFLFLIFPGIHRFGSHLSLSGAPETAGLYEEGLFLGSVDSEPFLKAGHHSLTLRYPGFEDRKIDVKVGGRLLGSLIFPRHQSLKIEPLQFRHASPREFTEYALKEFLRWNLTGPSREKHHKPMVLSNAVPLLIKRDQHQWAYALLRAAFGGISNAHSGGDWLYAAFGAGLLDDLLRRNTRMILAAAQTLEKSGHNPALLSPALSQYRAQLQSPSLKPDSTQAASPLTVKLSGSSLTLRPVPGGSGILGILDSRETPSWQDSAFPVPFDTEGFYLADREITNQQWQIFLQENPLWKGENRKELERKGLADDQYLLTFDTELQRSPEAPVRYISWHGAQAYCRWLNEKSRGTGSFRLPTEYEWEWAAAVNPSLSGMTGSLWEWCDDPYGFLIPLTEEELLFPDGGTADDAFPLKNLRGGSDINDDRTLTRSTRAGLFPSACPANAGFRPLFLPGSAGAGE